MDSHKHFKRKVLKNKKQEREKMSKAFLEVISDINSYPEMLRDKGCADWALKFCLAFSYEFFKGMKITPNYQRLNNKESWYDLDSLRKKLSEEVLNG